MWSRLKARLKAMARRLIPPPPWPLRVLEGRDVGEDVEIISLACPLRYDLLVRRDFFRYYSDHADLFASDFESFLDGPAAKDYYTFFRNARIRRYWPELYDSHDRLHEMFVDLVRRSVEVYRSIRTEGFDASKPVSLQTGRVVRHEQDVDVDARYYAGDGCHRIACLWALGFERLPKEYYQVKVYRVCRPLDVTAQLIGVLPNGRQRYWRYLAAYYCDGHDARDASAVIEYVKRHKPDRLAEVESVIRVHSEHF